MKIRPLCLSLLVASACAGAGDGSDWRGTMRDSAGITIVENPAEGMWTAETRPTVTEELKIGSMEGRPEEQFALIIGIDVDAQNNIYVLDQQARRVRVFGPDGTYLREMGGTGSGPGELSQVTMGVMLTAGDTVLVVDAGQARITRYAPGGEAIASTPLDMGSGIPIRWDKLPDLRLVNQVRSMSMQGQADAGPLEDLLLVRGSDGTVQDTIIELPAGQSFQMGGGGMRIRIFEPEPVWTLDQQGHVVFGMNSEYTLNVHDAEGALTRLVRMPFERQPVTEDDKQAFTRFISEAWRNAGVPPAAMDQMMASLGFADHYPAFASLLGGPQNTIWVQHVRTAAQVAESGGEFSAQDVGAADWDVLDAEGRFLGVLNLPQRFQPLRAAGNRIYGVWRDDLDVQHVMVLSVDL